MIGFMVTRRYLRANRDRVVFVFGDNDLHQGLGGAAALRHEPNAWGFVTKRAPNNAPTSFYRPEDYGHVFRRELARLRMAIDNSSEVTFLISRLGAGLADRYGIWGKIVRPGLEQLRALPNVVFLWECDDDPLLGSTGPKP